jgi:hypothetical protein
MLVANVDDAVDSLILDLLEWIGPNPRPYAEVLEVWRTSCPRLPVWEESNDRGFIARDREAGRGLLIRVSDAGWEHLRARRPIAGLTAAAPEASTSHTPSRPEASA